MALDPTIPLQAKTPDFNPLATLLQVGQYKYLQQNSNKLQMDMDANQTVGQAIQRNTGPDGRVNLLGVQTDLSKDPAAAYNLQATTGTNLAQQGQQALNAGQQISNDTGAQALATKRGEAVAKAGVALLTDPKATGADYISSLSDLHKQGIIDDKTYIDSVDHVTPHLKDTMQLRQIVRGTLAKLPDAIQATYVKPVLGEVSTGGATQFNSRDPLTGNVTGNKSVDNTLPPSQRETIETDSQGNKYIVQRSENGTVLGTRQVPGSYNPIGGKPGTGPANTPPGGQGAISALSDETNAARVAANQAPVLHDLNRQIIAEADKGFATGKLGAITQSVASQFGYKFSGDAATDYNVLGKLLERSAIQAAQGMGPQTNAGLQAQIQANGSLDYDPRAIRKAAVLNDALVSGAEHYNTGLQGAIRNNGGNVGVKPDFDRAWAQNFDPRIMRLQNAKQSGDTKEIAEILKEVGGANSKGARDLATKARNLNLLIQQGHL